MFRVGLVGAGYISEFHIRALRRLQNVTIVGITDMDVTRAREVAVRAGIAHAYSSLKDMVAEGLDVVHVLTPPAAHAAVAVEALERGCHVLVEKPLATSPEECDRIATAAKTAGKRVCVDHSMLYDFFIARALKVVRQGGVGDLLSADIFLGYAYPPYKGGALPPQYRAGGYPFRDVGTHALYLIEAFLGEIRHVETQFATQGGDPNLLYDEWRALVRCAHGSGQIYLSWNVHPVQNQLLIQGTRGVLRVDLSSMTFTLKKSTPLPKAAERPLLGIREGIQIFTQVPLNAFRFVRKKILQYHGLQMLVEDFYRTLASNEPPPVSVDQARVIVQWIEQSAREADEAKTRFLQKFPATLSAKILVTGALGFVGRHLVRRLLKQDVRVRIFVRREPPKEWMNNPNIEVVVGDLGDPEAVDRAVAGTEIVYHVGGAMKGGAHDHERGSVLGTRHIVESMKRHKVEKLVFISSLSVLWAAKARSGQQPTENAPLEQWPERRGVYSQSKLEAERIVLKAVKNDGLKAVVLRPAKVIGPTVQPLGFEIAFRVKQRMVIVGDGSLVPPMVHVEDLVDAILLAAKSDAFDGSIFHIVDSTKISRNELAKEYLRVLVPGGTITRVPMAVFYGLALMVQLMFKVLGRPAPLTTYKLRSAFAPLSFDGSAAEKRLGWKPTVGLHAGLQETLQSFIRSN